MHFRNDSRWITNLFSCHQVVQASYGVIRMPSMLLAQDTMVRTQKGAAAAALLQLTVLGKTDVT